MIQVQRVAPGPWLLTTSTELSGVLYRSSNEGIVALTQPRQSPNLTVAVAFFFVGVLAFFRNHFLRFAVSHPKDRDRFGHLG